MKLLFLLVAAGTGLAPFALADETGINGCEAPAAVRSVLLEGLPRPDLASWNIYPHDFVKLARLLPVVHKQFPGNVWMERIRIDAARTSSGSVPEALISAYERRYKQAPGDPQAAFLYGYSLIHTDTHRTIELLTPLAFGDAAIPVAIVTLAHIYGSGGPFEWATDVGKRSALTVIYLKRCSGAVDGEGMALAERNDPSSTLTSYVSALRERLAGKPDPALLRFYGMLWRLEGKALRQPAEVRTRISADMKYLEGLDPQKFPAAADVLALAAARLAGRTEVSTLGAALTDWQKANPEPRREADHEAGQAWQRKKLVQVDEWLASHKDLSDWYAPVIHFNVLTGLDDISNETILTEGEKLLASGKGAYPVANAWTTRGIALERAIGLIGQQLEECKRNAAYWDSDLYRGSYRGELRKFSDSFSCMADGWNVLATAYEKSGKLDEAHAVLTQWELRIAELRQRAEDARRRAAAIPQGAPNPLPPVARTLPDDVPNAERAFNRARARLAAAEGHGLDALVYYQAAFKGVSMAKADADLVEEAGRLWRQLGGTKEAWRIWVTGDQPSVQPGANGWTATQRPMVEFSLTDRTGGFWTLANLKGKTTLVSIWATWCPPCREEMPHVQALFNELAGRGDVQLITLNVDEDKSLIEPYLKNGNFTFPVLYAYDLLHGPKGFLHELQETGIPQTWVIDSSGVIRSKLMDFDGSGDKWRKAALDTLQKVSASRVPSAAGGK